MTGENELAIQKVREILFSARTPVQILPPRNFVENIKHVGCAGLWTLVSSGAAGIGIEIATQNPTTGLITAAGAAVLNIGIIAAAKYEMRKQKNIIYSSHTDPYNT